MYCALQQSGLILGQSVLLLFFRALDILWVPISFRILLGLLLWLNSVIELNHANFFWNSVGFFLNSELFFVKCSISCFFSILFVWNLDLYSIARRLTHETRIIRCQFWILSTLGKSKVKKPTQFFFVNGIRLQPRVIFYLVWKYRAIDGIRTQTQKISCFKSNRCAKALTWEERDHEYVLQLTHAHWGKTRDFDDVDEAGN